MNLARSKVLLGAILFYGQLMQHGLLPLLWLSQNGVEFFGTINYLVVLPSLNKDILTLILLICLSGPKS